MHLFPLLGARSPCSLLCGSIPLVGHLFKRKATSTTTKELLFFITPKIVQS